MLEKVGDAMARGAPENLGSPLFLHRLQVTTSNLVFRWGLSGPSCNPTKKKKWA